MTDTTLKPWSEPRLGALWGAAWQSVPVAITRTLAAGGAALEVGCGSGLACLALAEAIPEAHVTGHDEDAAAITRARELAHAAGLGTRLRFAVSDSTRLPRSAFHLVTIEALRERASDPRRVLNAIRNALHPDGACLLLELSTAGLAVPALPGLASVAGFSRVKPLPCDGRVRLYELRR